MVVNFLVQRLDVEEGADVVGPAFSTHAGVFFSPGKNNNGLFNERDMKGLAGTPTKQSLANR